MHKHLEKTFNVMVIKISGLESFLNMLRGTIQVQNQQKIISNYELNERITLRSLPVFSKESSNDSLSLKLLSSRLYSMKPRRKMDKAVV